MDKLTQLLIDALKLALARPGEQRLFKSGKLDGIFSSRVGLSATAAALAFRDGLLEQTRTETKGKTVVEWVRVTPKAVDFLHQHESPVRAMDELRAALEKNHEGIPAWIQDIRKELDSLSQRMLAEVQAIGHRLEALSQRVAEGMRRADEMNGVLGDEVLVHAPWARHALDYLEKRKESGVANPCPLPELFHAMQAGNGGVALKDFHSGLRVLHDKSVLRLLSSEEQNGLEEPEYALLDGATTYYYVMQ